jgi:hypothetical protein
MAFGIDMGPSTAEGTQYNNLSGLSSTEANMGLGDLSQSQNFMESILSGDPTKIGQILGPQIKAIQGQGQQQKQTQAQFGNRSGGTNASNQTIDDKTRGSINDLISSLTGSAVSGLNNTGLSLTGQAQSGFGTAFNQANTMQAQRAAMFNDLFKSIGDTATGFATGFGG